jgi:hypothetical protein
MSRDRLILLERSDCTVGLVHAIVLKCTDSLYDFVPYDWILTSNSSTNNLKIFPLFSKQWCVQNNGACDTGALHTNGSLSQYKCEQPCTFGLMVRTSSLTGHSEVPLVEDSHCKKKLSFFVSCCRNATMRVSCSCSRPVGLLHGLLHRSLGSVNTVPYVATVVAKL